MYRMTMRDAGKCDGFFAAKAAREEMEHNMGRNYVCAPGEETSWQIHEIEGMDPAHIDMTNAGTGEVRVSFGGHGCNASYEWLRPLAQIRAMLATSRQAVSNEIGRRFAAHEWESLRSAESDGRFAENGAAFVAKVNANRTSRLAALKAKYAAETGWDKVEV